jgi:XTP/dITP diphosphohydrolase
MQIVLATRNQHKAVELERILLELDLQFELLTVDKFPDAPEVEETENTFEGNALLKARALCTFTGLPAIADDSGICIDALDGNPGVLSARWSGATEYIDQANVDLVLAQTAAVPEGQRGAQFQCAAVAVFPDGREFVSLGSMPGALLTAPRGSNGFGYDPIFVPDGFTKTTAEMSASDKDEISHRGIALRKLAQLLKEG